MTDTKAAPEPSMEEILASIRQIINQSDAPEEEAPAELAAPSEYAPLDGESDPADLAPEEEDDVMELTSILEEEAPAPVVEPTPEPVFTPEPVAVAPAPPPPPVQAPAPLAPAPTMAPNAELITGSTAMAAAAALSGLANTVYQERIEQSLPIGNHTRTLEGMVVEAIKPLLKEWCDENLPAIVERIVQAEVEKLTKRIGG